LPAEQRRRQERAGPLRRRARLAACLLAVLSSATATPSRGAEAPGSASQPDTRGYVQLTIAADEDSASALVETLRELVARLGLTLRVTRTASIPGALTATAPIDGAERARVSVDEARADRVRVQVSAIRDGQVAAPVERTVPRGESRAILAEQIGHVIHSTLESLLVTEAPAPPPEPAGPKAAPTVAEPTAPTAPTAPAASAATEPAAPVVERPVDAPPPAPKSRLGGLSLDATAFATGRAVASGAGPVLGAGAAMNVTAWPAVGRPSLWLGGSYSAPFDERTAQVSLRTTVSSLRGIPGVQVVGGRMFDVDVGVGAGADVFHTVPSNPGAMVTLGPAKDVVDPVLTAQVVTRIRVAAIARIVVGVDLDYDLGAHRYVTADASDVHTPVYQPWPVRPSAMLGLCVPLLGALGCGGGTER
jgi:hypothetical protein